MVLVTGAGHGIGRQLALRLGALGCMVVCVDKDEETNRATAADIRAVGGVAWSFQCDVSLREEVAEMAGRVREEVGDVNILVNNAGIMVIKQVGGRADSLIFLSSCSILTQMCSKLLT